MRIRCPHCHHPIEVVDTDPLTDVSCPECGSNFSLISGETASYAPGVVKTVGHFELLESVGAGRFGTVWKARDTKLDRTVAIKIPRRGQIEGPEAEMFIREARAAAQVKHPGVVSVHEVGREKGVLYIVSDFIDGCSLKEWLTGHKLTPRETAELCTKIAEALDVAHKAGVIHRDLKPGNIVMDMAGQPHLTDFGLAKREAGEITMTVDGQVLGTPAYMSPEQARGEAHAADRRSDVYSLGVILFELLTGERPFRGNQRMMVVQILQDEPPSPRKLQTRIPRDLETICLKCLEKSPGKRYQTAAELAAELGRFLRGEPIFARPIGRTARLRRWCNRNPLLAGVWAVGALFLALCAFAVGAFLYEQTRVEISEARGQANERESLMFKVEGLLRPGRSDGWSTQAWDMERRIVNLGTDSHVRDQAAAIIGGLDAHKLKLFKGFGVTDAVFDLSGKRLLVSTVTVPKGQIGNTKLYNLDTDDVQDLKIGAIGPVGFRDDGKPLQLAARQKDLVLLDPSKGDVLHRLDLPQGAIVRPPGLMAMTRNGSFVAAVATTADGKSVLVAWNAASGRRLAEFPVSENDTTLELSPDGPLTALELSPDGALIAVGMKDGVIAVWSIKSAARVALLQAHQIKIHCLAFGRDRRRVTASADSAAHSWLLAAGDAGGTVTIWDLDRKIPRSYCRGSLDDVYAVKFSPDGLTIASSGRGPTKLWNVATGSLLLDLNAGDYNGCLAFSPVGRNLAVGSAGPFARSGGMLTVWSLESARGLEGLRGLEAQVSKVCFSQDGHLVAALGQNWEMAIWDLPSGFLRHVLKVPQGLVAGNAAMAFSPDGSRIAYTAGHEARSWDVGSGDELNRWELNDGYVDELAYAGPDKLLSFRVEAEVDKRIPFEKPRAQNPLVCRLRHLPDKAAARLIKEIPDFNWHVYTAAASPTGKYFAVDGLSGPAGERRMIKLFDEMGREIAQIPTTRTREIQYGWLLFDPTGSVLAALVSPDDRATLLEMPSARPARQFDLNPYCLSPGGKFWLHIGQPATRERPKESNHGVSLFRGGDKEPVVVFDIDSTFHELPAQFDVTGTLVAWGRSDGTITVCNLPEIERRLTPTARSRGF